jgi:hypothetical protein
MFRISSLISKRVLELMFKICTLSLSAAGPCRDLLRWRRIIPALTPLFEG